MHQQLLLLPSLKQFLFSECFSGEQKGTTYKEKLSFDEFIDLISRAATDLKKFFNP